MYEHVFFSLTKIKHQVRTWNMKSSNHIFKLFWVPGREVPVPRTTSIDTENEEDVLAYQTEVGELEVLREQLRETAQTATGAIHDLPQVDGAPRVVERPYSVTEVGQKYTAWNLFAVDSTGQEHQLSMRMLNIDGGVMWLEPIRSEREIRRIVPPPSNIRLGLKCVDCRRFSYEQGQNWLNQVTHKHENGDDRMWRDVVEMVAERLDVEAPNSLTEFGACLEESKLVLKDYPGCAKYSPRGFKGTECLISESLEVAEKSLPGK